MNNYSRLEINLLPPEMAPGPAVQTTTLIAWLIAGAGLAFIALNFLTSWKDIQDKSRERNQLKTEIAQMQPVVETYDSLEEIRKNTEGRGKLVGMASAGYIEYPIILDRVSKILPDGVYLVKVSTTGSATRGSSEVILQFRTAQKSADLMAQTIEAFKGSPMFSESYLQTANFRQQPLDELTDDFGINYSFTKSSQDSEFNAQTFDFEIRARVASPLTIEDLTTALDNTDLMTEFELQSDPTAVQPARPAAENAGAAAPAGGGQASAGAAPAAGGAR